MGKILNPATGRWVSRKGAIGKELVRMKVIVTNKEKYERVKKLWDLWSEVGTKDRQKVSEIWWDTRLNDPMHG